MSFDYIRKAYSVPAKRGMRIEFKNSAGSLFDGEIKSTRDGKIVARFFCFKPTHRTLLHPTWHMRYYDGAKLIYQSDDWDK